jgi:hypothetical protein
MSLFGSERYQWRETYLILFDGSRRPSAAQVGAVIEKLGRQYQVKDVREDGEGCFDSLTLISPDDYAAMDISFVSGDEVIEQTEELLNDLKLTATSAAEKATLRRLAEFTARFDIYHFEEVVLAAGEENEFMDPGCLLQVMEELTEMVDGIAVDPAAGALL